MPRILTKGKPITVRLLLPADTELRRRAAERHEHPGRWIARQIERALAQSPNAVASPGPVARPDL